jgi:hypothetical protein
LDHDKAGVSAFLEIQAKCGQNVITWVRF